ncbi:MAG: hypothetical protein WKF66_12690 [Pedobacter sp.]
MSQLSIYESLKEKRRVFKSTDYFTIDSAKDFDRWYKEISKLHDHSNFLERNNNGLEIFDDAKYNYYPYIFRGVGDAKYKIFLLLKEIGI